MFPELKNLTENKALEERSKQIENIVEMMKLHKYIDFLIMFLSLIAFSTTSYIVKSLILGGNLLGVSIVTVAVLALIRLLVVVKDDLEKGVYVIAFQSKLSFESLMAHSSLDYDRYKLIYNSHELVRLDNLAKLGKQGVLSELKSEDVLSYGDSLPRDIIQNHRDYYRKELEAHDDTYHSKGFLSFVALSILSIIIMSNNSLLAHYGMLDFTLTLWAMIATLTLVNSIKMLVKENRDERKRKVADVFTDALED